MAAPSAANAAQVQACTTSPAPTAATQIYYDFGQTAHSTADSLAAFNTANDQLIAATAGIGPSSTQAELNDADNRAYIIVQAAFSNVEGDYFKFQIAYYKLAAALVSTGGNAALNAFGDEFESDFDGFSSAFSTVNSTFGAYSNSATDQLEDPAPIAAAYVAPDPSAPRAAISTLGTALDSVYAHVGAKAVLQPTTTCATVIVADLAVASVNSTYGKAASVALSLAKGGAPLAGTVTVLVDGKPLSNLAVAGTGAVALPATLPVGTHYVTSAFNSTDGLGPVTAVGTVVVKKATTAATIKLSHSSVKKGKSAKVAVTVTAPGASVTPTGKVTVYVNGKKFATKSLSKGKATVSLKTSKKGKQKVLVKYAATTSYSADNSTSKTLTVK